LFIPTLPGVIVPIYERENGHNAVLIRWPTVAKCCWKFSGLFCPPHLFVIFPPLGLRLNRLLPLVADWIREEPAGWEKEKKTVHGGGHLGKEGERAKLERKKEEGAAL
jgi:hypothetical protein